MTIGQVESLKFSYEEFICYLLGVKPNPDYPFAAMDYQKNHKHYYLYADPVYLSLQRDTFFLEKKLTDDYTKDEIEKLCHALNETFEDETRVFVLNDNEQLFLELKKEPHIKTTSIAHIKRQSIDKFMPQGDEAMAWHAKQCTSKIGWMSRTKSIPESLGTCPWETIARTAQSSTGIPILAHPRRTLGWESKPIGPGESGKLR